MTIIIFCLPIICAIILLLFFRQKVTFWEYIVLIVPSVLIAVFMQYCMKSFNANDVEYLGFYIEKTTHYDEWNEYIRKTCTRSVYIGRDSEGNAIYEDEEYDCSYVKDHPEKWSYTTNDGYEVNCTKERFDKLRKKFNAPSIFRDMHRNYHTIDGDAQDYFWQKQLDKVETVTREHNYENRTKASKSIFGFKKLKKKDIKNYRLYDYPEIDAEEYQPSVIGIDLPSWQTRHIDAINAVYGRERQIRIFLLFFPDAPALTADYQKAYWEGGNKNEVVICLGYDSKTHKIKWCEGFSWSDIPLIESKTKQYFLSHPDINLKEYSNYIIPYIMTDWNRKAFDDFSYINIELTTTQYMIIFIVTMLYCLGISIWIVCNEYENEV